MPDTDNEDLPETPKPGKKKPAAPAAAASPPPPPPPPAAPEPKKFKHTSRLTALAIQFGYTQADLDETDAATLWEEIDRLQALAARRRPAPEPVAKKAEPEVDEDEEFLKEQEEAGVDPRYIAYLRRQTKRTKAAEARAAKAEELEKKFGEQTKQQQRDAIDAGFMKLAENPAFAAVVGTGYAHETSDPGHRGWRNAIVNKCPFEDGDSLATITRKVISTGTSMLAGKAPAANSPPPPPAPPPPPVKVPPKDPVSGRFTSEDFAGGVLPQAGDRRAERNGLTGAAVIHEHFRQIGDERGEREFVDDSNDDLPE